MGFKAEINNSSSPVTPDESFRPGMVAMTAATGAPSGFLLCDGSEYDPLLYPALFVAIGTAYNTGGETPGFFRVPAFQARVPVGVGTIGGQVWARGTQYGSEALQQHTHTVTDPGHNHTQNAHTHTVTDPGHNHTQDAHTHTQNAHTHTQDAHTHTQNAHNHGISDGTGVSGGGGLFAVPSAAGGVVSANTTATNQNTTATNQNTTATNQNTTATNQSNTTGITNQNATATNNSNTTGLTVNNAGTGTAGNIQPSLGINFIIKT